MCVFSHSVVSDSVTPWTVACQAPLSMGFSRQEYRSGLQSPSPGDLADSETEPTFPVYLTGEGNGTPLQYSCLENPMDRGAWQATVHGVARVRHDLGTKPAAHSK